MDLSSIFAAATSGTAVVAAGLAYWLAGPRQLKPDNASAKVITARRFPNILTVQKFAVKDSSALYLKWGASKADEVPLKIFPVGVERTGKAALLVNDKMKIEVEATFHVSVNGDGLASDAAEGEQPVTMTGEQAIIKAIESLGEVNQDTVSAIVEARFDNALRVAAAGLTVEKIHANRAEFLKAVKEALVLSDCGLKLNDLAIRTLTPASIDAYDPNNAFDAEGLKIVTQITQESRRRRNDIEQDTATQIEGRNKDESIKRLAIQREQREAQLKQGEEVANMEAGQKQRVAEVTAGADKMARLAQVVADEEVEVREIAKTRKLDVEGQAKEQAVTSARVAKERVVEAALIEKQTTIQTAERDREIALSRKAAEAAEAEAVANEARAKAVEAAQKVETVKAVAEADRSAELQVIAARGEAQKQAAGRTIESEAAVAVAENRAKAQRTEAQGAADAVRIEAESSAAAVKLAANANYEQVFMAAKAVADGKMADAAAVEALNRAHNAMDAGVRQYQLDRFRVEQAPLVVSALAESFSKVGEVKIFSGGGIPGFGTGAGTGMGSGGGGTSNIFEQYYGATTNAVIRNAFVSKVLESLGSDPKIADHLPDIRSALDHAVSAVPAPAVVTPVAASEQDNTLRLPQGPAAGMAP